MISTKRSVWVSMSLSIMSATVALSAAYPSAALADTPPKAPSINNTKAGISKPVRVEFQPLTDDEKKKVFEVEKKEEKPKPAPSSVTTIQAPRTVVQTVVVTPPQQSQKAESASDETIILPPDWEGFVDELSSGSSSDLGSSQTSSLMSSVAPRYDNETAQKMIDYAYSQLGVPYVWGGTTTNVGLDCSGLTQNAYAAAGISIPRTTWDQINIGPHVSVSEAQPGDLVFYSNTGHVALYIGDGQVIHAPEPGDVVKIAPIDMMPVEAVVRAA